MVETNRRSGVSRSRRAAVAAARARRRARPALAVAGLLVTAALGTTDARAGTAGTEVAAGEVEGVAAASGSMPPFGPDTCVQGRVWREAKPNDHVCVPVATRTQTRDENNRAPGLVDPDPGGPFGVDRCKSGFVWREAIPGDHACVDPPVRGQARRDTEQAPMHWVATFDRHIAGNFVPHPFAMPDQWYHLNSSFTTFASGGPLIADVLNASAADGAQLILWTNNGGHWQDFQFRRAGGKLAFQNVFEIVIRHSNKCLDVTGFSKNDGARVIQWPCHGGDNQKWYLQRRGDNEWEVRSVLSDKCLDAHNPNNPAATLPPIRTPLQQWTCLGGKNQAWRLKATA